MSIQYKQLFCNSLVFVAQNSKVTLLMNKTGIKGFVCFLKGLYLWDFIKSSDHNIMEHMWTELSTHCQ